MGMIIWNITNIDENYDVSNNVFGNDFDDENGVRSGANEEKE